MSYSRQAVLNSITYSHPATHDTGRMLLTLMQNINGMVYRCRNDAHWTMEFVSDGCLSLTGYAPEELLLNREISYEAITHPDDRDLVRWKIGKALQGGRRFNLEYRIIRADGTLRWVWERGIGVFAGGTQLLGIEGVIVDITKRKSAENAMAEAERRYRSIFENAIEGIFQSTPDGHYLEANPALARIYGYHDPAELIARLGDIKDQLYVDPSRREAFMDLVTSHGTVSNFESQVYRKDGTVIWISENARAVRGENGALLFFEGTVEDITERKRHQAEIEHQATHDALTGLPNRMLFNDRLQQAIRYAERTDGRLAVVFVDLDQFKDVNDSLGHAAGDQLLVVIAERLRSVLRDSDTVARHGGDEFVLLLSGRTDSSTALERLREALTQPWSLEGIDFHITCSLGVSLYPDDGMDAETLMKNADTAMYRAKEVGRNQTQYFSAEMDQRLKRRLAMQAGLRQAVERGELQAWFQPKLDGCGRRIVGAEVLLRWCNEEFGMVSPLDFIPLAEETGLIIPIGLWVLNAACEQHRLWREQGLPPLPLSVNVSPRQMYGDDLIHAVSAALQRNAMAPQFLELEITENLLMRDREKAVELLRRLRALGVTIAVDDFGTGYSSLSYLKRFPIDRLKIDQSFVRDWQADSDTAAIIKTIIGLGHSLGLKVVAEGVENAGQQAFLRENGCDELQGYYFAKPLPADQFGQFLQNHWANQGAHASLPSSQRAAQRCP